MAEESSLIDRVYDRLEEGAVTIGAVLGIDVRDEARQVADERRNGVRARGEAGALPAAQATRVLGAGTVKAFTIEEVIDADTSKTVHVVTNGVQKYDCPSRAFADQLLGELAKRGCQVAIDAQAREVRK